MAEIKVAQKDSETFEVTVIASATTTHTVKLKPDYCQKLTEGKVLPATLIEKSFEFLLERRSKTQKPVPPHAGSGQLTCCQQVASC